MNRATPQPRDAVLPQLGIALDARAMQAVFDTALRRQDGTRVNGCRVDRVKYRPQRNCTVSWLLDVENGRDGATSVQRAAGRFCAAGEAAPRHGRHHARASLPTRCGAAALLVPELELFAWFVPNDPKLAGLGRLCNTVQSPEAPFRQLRDSLDVGNAGAMRIRGELIRYIPESRACARFTIDTPGGGEPRHVYAKIARDGTGCATDALMRTLQSSPAQAAGRLLTPRPLLWQADGGLHWQEAVPGQALTDLYPDGCPPDVAARVGRLLAALHSTPALQGGGVDRLTLLRRQREDAQLIAEIEPSWAPLALELLTRLAANAVSIDALPPATLHGDLHAGNILAEGDRLALIDLDCAYAGQAVLELGAWIAGTILSALAAGTVLAPIQDSAAALLRAYRAASPHPASPRQVAWAVAHALLCQRACSCIANLHRGRYPLVPALLTLAVFIARHGVEDRPLPNL